MSREKQIKEMDTIIRDAVNGCSSYWSGLIADALFETDYRKVIRCKDCLYSYFNSSSERYSCQRQYPRRHVEEDDFCNYAKMKGGAE